MSTKLTTDGVPFEMKEHGPLRGVVSSFNGNLKDVPDEQLQNLAEANSHVAKLGAGKIPVEHYGFLSKVKASNPAFSYASGATVAREVAADYEHIRFAKQAEAEGKLLSFPTPDGKIEYGVVSGEKGALKREGLWTTVDKDGMRREQAFYESDVKTGIERGYHPDGKNVAYSNTYEAGVKTGTSLKFNEKSEPIHKSTFDNGVLKEEKVIDPVVYNQERQQARAEKAAIKAIKF